MCTQTEIHKPTDSYQQSSRSQVPILWLWKGIARKNLSSVLCFCQWVLPTAWHLPFMLSEIKMKAGTATHIDCKFLTCVLKYAKKACLEILCAFVFLLFHFFSNIYWGLIMCQEPHKVPPHNVLRERPPVHQYVSSGGVCAEVWRLGIPWGGVLAVFCKGLRRPGKYHLSRDLSEVRRWAFWISGNSGP